MYFLDNAIDGQLTPNQRDATNAEERLTFCVAKGAPLSVVA